MSRDVVKESSKLCLETRRILRSGIWTVGCILHYIPFVVVHYIQYDVIRSGRYFISASDYKPLQLFHPLYLLHYTRVCFIIITTIIIMALESVEMTCVSLFDNPFRSDSVPCMPTLPDYPGVSRSSVSPYLPNEIIFWAFLFPSLRFSPFLAQNLNFSYSVYGFWGI